MVTTNSFVFVNELLRQSYYYNDTQYSSYNAICINYGEMSSLRCYFALLLLLHEMNKEVSLYYRNLFTFTNSFDVLYCVLNTLDSVLLVLACVT